jgi:uncharacterized protein YoxC
MSLIYAVIAIGVMMSLYSISLALSDIAHALRNVSAQIERIADDLAYGEDNLD